MTIKQAWNRTKAWVFHTFVYRGDFYCKRSGTGLLYASPTLCPHCEREFQKWRKDLFDRALKVATNEVGDDN